MELERQDYRKIIDIEQFSKTRQRDEENAVCIRLVANVH